MPLLCVRGLKIASSEMSSCVRLGNTGKCRQIQGDQSKERCGEVVGQESV